MDNKGATNSIIKEVRNYEGYSTIPTEMMEKYILEFKEYLKENSWSRLA